MNTASISAAQRLKIDRAIERAAEDAAPLFAANRWKWHSLGPGIPQVSDIRRLLREFADNLNDAPECSRVASGRLVAERYEGEEGEELAFYIELSDTETA